MGSKVTFLPKGTGSLNSGPPTGGAPPQPGTLFVLGANGGMSVTPDAGFPLFFGRNEPDVHVCVGGHDKHVSRRQGLITREYSRWMLTNTGRAPIRFPGSRLVLGGDQVELPTGYTPLFIVAPRQEHLLEVRIAAPTPRSEPGRGREVYDEKTGDDARDLSETEKLVLVCLAQRYLRDDPHPQPLTWGQVADELNALGPKKAWTQKRAARVVAKVRKNLSRQGVHGLLEKEVPPPAGNALNHNLITDLLVTTTITRSDLRRLGDH
ncbi:hypothetical protein [Streptomyces sp. URMC 129]|uniref:hypothetical protein n=1 Tax=Streptomyces sp. URMC 129 TaxID=3423407 RepID=UPI003F19D2F2